MRLKNLTKLGLQLSQYLLLKRLGFPKILPTNLTLNVTYHCNSRCSTCNIWKKKAQELTLSEWKKIFKKYNSRVFWLILSGGEPFLRPDLADLAIAGYHYLNPSVINIPTNGLLTSVIVRETEKILKKCRGAEIIINFSLDGVEKGHDEIRNVPGNFKKLINSYRQLFKLKKIYPNLTIGLHTVVSKFNVKKIPKLCDFALSLSPDQYISEIAENRVELDTIDKKISPSPQEYSEVIDQVIKKIHKTDFKGVAKITESLRVEYYNLVKKIIVKKEQILPCYAGWASGQISADGEVWPCCVRADNLGSLRKNNYSFRDVWFNEEGDKIRKSIKNKECFCPLASASYTSMLLSPSFLFKICKNLLTK